MVAKIKTPQKSLGLPTKPQKLPGLNINPQKVLCQISKAKFGCTLFGELSGHESSDFFEYPQTPYLNQSTQKNTRQIFLLKKILESKISNPKTRDHLS